MNRHSSLRTPFPTTLCFVIALLLLASFASPRKGIAQNVYAALHGTVTDSSGAVVPNATVKVTNGSTGITTDRRADKNGYYIFPQLQVGGPYTVGPVPLLKM